MEKFDERKKSFEKKFAHDEELKFKVAAKRNKYLGEWASQKLGYDITVSFDSGQITGEKHNASYVGINFLMPHI